MLISSEPMITVLSALGAGFMRREHTLQVMQPDLTVFTECTLSIWS